MWNKIYYVALAFFLLLMCILTYFSFSWLQSLTNPADVVANYEYYSNMAWVLLWVSTVILLILANIILWNMRQTWAFWVTLAYFVIFIILQTFWLEQSFFRYKESNNLASGISFSPFLGVGLCVAAAAFIFFNQLLTIKMHDRMFVKEEPVAELPEAGTNDENPTN